jgi:two-component system chemotaxis response regulator CheB
VDRTPDAGPAPDAVVCVGASAGGVDALQEFVGGVDERFSGAVLVVLHLPVSAGSALDRILARASGARSEPASDGAPIERGALYVARPDHHLVVGDGRLGLLHGPREHGVRPAIDPLFRSVARAYGPAAIGVVLSGTGDDGSAGLAAVKRLGGMTLVQDPDHAAFRGMPARALEVVSADKVGTPAELAAAAVERTVALSGAKAAWSGGPVREDGRADVLADPRAPSAFTCPDCGGTLFEAAEDGVERFVCRVGHAYSGETLLQHQDERIEDVLWSAVRAFEERADLADRVAGRLRRAGLERQAQRYRARIEESIRHARQLRDFVLGERDEREVAGE